MDQQFAISPEDLYNLQMEVKQVQYAQSNHAERLLRLEKRQTDDSAIKSVWNSPFPGVLAGTPQQGPVHHNDVFDDSDEQGEQLLGSLHLGPAEEEPVRRGAASRANSVRFDESALHGSSWSGAQSNRHSGEFGSIRPGGGLLMERTLSHKSDGRHSSAGHSVHSHHSIPSGRASSAGLDVGDDDDSSFGIPEPPVSLYVLGSVPSIIRCWLTTNFAHGTLLYVDVCSGAKKSTVAHSLLEELDLVGEIERDVDGVCHIRLNVFFAEAVVSQRTSRPATPEGLVPSMSVRFEVYGINNQSVSAEKHLIRAFVGSDALRAHSADILFSQNTMVLYGTDRDKLRVPFVRPEDDAIFRHICTVNSAPEKPKLNANAAPFVLGDMTQSNDQDTRPSSPSAPDEDAEAEAQESVSPTAFQRRGRRRETNRNGSVTDENKPPRDSSHGDGLSGKEEATGSESSRRASSTGIWGSWRHGASGGNDKEPGPISGYQPAPRSGRGMKILKSGKSSSSAKTGASYEPPLPSRSSEGRRKSQVSVGGEGTNGGNRWDLKRSVSAASDAKSHSSTREGRKTASLPKATNPVGGASAFSWMTPSGKTPKTPTSGST